MLELRFFSKDEYGNETETRKTYNSAVLEEQFELDLLMTDFRQHLVSSGYTPELIKEFWEKHNQ